MDLELFPKAGMVKGHVAIAFVLPDTTIDSLRLDAVRMSVHRVSYNGVPAGYRNSGKELIISRPKERLHSGDTCLLEVDYSCTPRKGIYFQGWHEGQGAPQIWTQGQGIDHRHWIPHQDDQRDKLTHSIFLKFPAEYEVISNGLLESSELSGEERMWKYRTKEPGPSYLIALAIGHYSFLQHSAGKRQLKKFHYLDQAHTMDHARIEEILPWMEGELGLDLPWTGPYREVPVRNFKHGAMENTGCVLLGDFFLQDARSPFLDRSFLEIEAHELAHHWFGNFVTARDIRAHWFHEGFASYWQWEAKRQFESKWQYRRAREAAQRRILSFEEKNGGFSIEQNTAGSIGFYDKAGWVLSMLIDALGPAKASESIASFLSSRAYGWTDSYDLWAHLEKQGVSFAEPFYTYWVKGRRIPNIQCSVENEKLIFEDSTGAPCRIEWLGIKADGSVVEGSLMKMAQRAVADLPEGIRWVVPDPHHRLLARWKNPMKLEDVPWSQLSEETTTACLRHLTKGDLPDALLHMDHSGRSLALWQTAQRSAAQWPELFHQLHKASVDTVLWDALLTERSLPIETSEAEWRKIWGHGTYRSMQSVVEWMDRTDHPDLISKASELLALRAPSVQLHAVTAAYVLHKRGRSEGGRALMELAKPKNEFNTRSRALYLMSDGQRPIWDAATFLHCLSDYFDPNARVALPCRAYVKAYAAHVPNPFSGMDLSECSSGWSEAQRNLFEKQTKQRL